MIKYLLYWVTWVTVSIVMLLHEPERKSVETLVEFKQCDFNFEICAFSLSSLIFTIFKCHTHNTYKLFCQNW